MNFDELRKAIDAAPGDALIVDKSDLERLIGRVEQLQRVLTNIGSQARTA